MPAYISLAARGHVIIVFLPQNTIENGYMYDVNNPLRLVNAASLRTISIDKKKISSGTRGRSGMEAIENLY